MSEILRDIALVIVMAAILHGITDIEKRITAFETAAKGGGIVIGCSRDWIKHGKKTK